MLGNAGPCPLVRPMVNASATIIHPETETAQCIWLFLKDWTLLERILLVRCPIIACEETKPCPEIVLLILGGMHMLIWRYCPAITFAKQAQKALLRVAIGIQAKIAASWLRKQGPVFLGCLLVNMKPSKMYQTLQNSRRMKPLEYEKWSISLIVTGDYLGTTPRGEI